MASVLQQGTAVWVAHQKKESSTEVELMMWNLSYRLINLPAVKLTDGLAGSLTNWLTDWWIDWLTGFLTGRVPGRQAVQAEGFRYTPSWSTQLLPHWLWPSGVWGPVATLKTRPQHVNTASPKSTITVTSTHDLILKVTEGQKSEDVTIETRHPICFFKSHVTFAANLSFRMNSTIQLLSSSFTCSCYTVYIILLWFISVSLSWAFVAWN